MNQERNDQLSAALDTKVYDLVCEPGHHRYTGYRMMVGTPCWNGGCGKPLTISQPEGETMQATTIVGSSTAEHQALNLDVGGSSPPPRTEEVNYHFHSTVRGSSKGRTPAFEAEDGGSTPPPRSTPETPTRTGGPSVRRGHEMDLDSGVRFGWYETGTDDGMAMGVNGQVGVTMTADEWWTFLTYAYDPDEHEADLALVGVQTPPGDERPLSSQVRDLQARNDWQAQTIRKMSKMDEAQQETIRLSAERVAELTAENTELRKSLAEALQAIDESTEVIGRQTEETGYLVAEVTRLRAALEGYPGAVDRWKRMARQNAEERDEYRSQLDAARDDIAVLKAALSAAQGKPPTLKLTVERPERGAR